MVDRVFTLLVTPIVLLVAVAGWWTVASRLLRGEPVLPWEERAPTSWGLVDVLFALVAMFVLAGAALALTADPQSLASGEEAPPSMTMLAAGSAASLAAMLLSLCAVKLRSGASWRELGFDWRQAGRDVKLGLVAFAMMAPIVYGIQLVLVEWLELRYEQPLIDLLRQSPTRQSIAVTIFAAVLAAPFAEEVFFRMLLLGWLEKAATHHGPPVELILGARRAAPAEQETAAAEGPAAEAAPSGDSRAAPIGAAPPRGPLFGALVLSSVLFAIVHASQGLAPTIPLFLFALALGFLYQRTHRLLPCVTMHFALNAFTTIVLLIEVLQPRA